MSDEIIDIWDLTLKWEEGCCFDEEWPEYVDCNYRCPVCDAPDGRCMDIIFDKNFGVSHG